MNFIFIPKIESGTGGLRAFDMTFGYTYQQAKQFVLLLSPKGLDVYLHKQLPLDSFIRLFTRSIRTPGQVSTFPGVHHLMSKI